MKCPDCGKDQHCETRQCQCGYEFEAWKLGYYTGDEANTVVQGKQNLGPVSGGGTVKYRIASFSIGQLVKISTVLYTLLGVLFVPFYLVMSAMNPEARGVGLGLALLLPVFYAVLGAIGAVLVGGIYNLAAKQVGGIEVKLDLPRHTIGGSEQERQQG